MIALLALQALAAFDEALILGLLGGPLLQLSAAALGLLDGAGQDLIRAEQLQHLLSRRIITGIQCQQDLLQKPDILFYIGRGRAQTLALPMHGTQDRLLALRRL